MEDFIEKIDQLPQRARDFFFSNDLRIEMEKSCFLYGVTEEDNMTLISDEIAAIFSKDSELSKLPDFLSRSLQLDISAAHGLSYELNKRLFGMFPDIFTDSEYLLDQWEKLKGSPVISEEEAMNSVIAIEPWILEEQKEKIRQKREFREEEETQKQNMEEIAISDGLAKYPEIGEQIITSQHIRLKIFPEPVRPSIKNWLSDYTFNLGYESHDAMARGDYLFRSENGKGLSQEDREKLSLILKSYDEKIPLIISISAKQVLFSEIEPRQEKKPEIVTPAEPRKPEPPSTPKPDFQKPSVKISPEREEPIPETSNIKFSSPQIFTNEKRVEEIGMIQPIRIKPASRRDINGYSKDDKNLPGKVINLKR